MNFRISAKNVIPFVPFPATRLARCDVVISKSVGNEQSQQRIYDGGLSGTITSGNHSRSSIRRHGIDLAMKSSPVKHRQLVQAVSRGGLVRRKF
jgi:hypothetical protein